MTAWDVDRVIERLARRQHGVFSYAQARRAGASSRIIRDRVVKGRWAELDSRVYALPSHPGTWRRQCMGAVLAVTGASVSHSAAAALHRLVGYRQGRIHLVASPNTNHRSRLATVHESVWARRTIVDGIPVVTLADTFFQLAGGPARQRLRPAFGDAVVVRPGLLAEMFDRYVELAPKRLPGIGVVRKLLDEHDDGAAPPNSELEWLLDGLLDCVEGLPTRQRQAPLPGWDRGASRVDVLIPDLRLIIEADGRRWHSRVDDFERDRWRDNIATTQGYDVLRFTFRQLTNGGRAESLALLTHYIALHRRAS